MVAVVLKLAFISLLPQALGLHCWGCTSTESWADCESKLQSSFCSNGTSHACRIRELTITTPEKTTVDYAKECLPLNNCNETLCNVRDRDTRYSCRSHCCCHDNCNTGVPLLGEAGVHGEAGVRSLHGVCVMVPVVIALYSTMTQ
ncbi:hypothetical protein ACROYT_G008198 [Oculina patagonica]